jgi:hypothetical protein
LSHPDRRKTYAITSYDSDENVAANACSTGKHLSLIYSSRRGITTNTAPTNGDVVVPEGVDIVTVRLPTEVNSSNLGLDGASLPLVCIRIGDTRLFRKTSNSISVQPSLNTAVGAQVIFETFPGTDGKCDRGGNALRREVWEGRIVDFAIVHQDLALTADAEMLVGALGGVRHGDEGDVIVGEGSCGFAGKVWMLACLLTLRILL